MTALRTELDAWINSHPFDSERVARRAEDAEQLRQAWLRGNAEGSYCVNRAIFERLHALEGSAPLQDVSVDKDAARQVRRRLAATVDAWLLAWREFEAGRRASATFAILDLKPHRPSLDSGQILGTRRSPAPTERPPKKSRR